MNTWFRFRQARFALLAVLLALFVIGALTTSTLNLGAQGGAWEGRYWNNRDLSGNPVLVRQDASINFDWGGGSPAPQVFTDNFSAQWTQTASLPAGTYRFSATADDGMRVWVDNVLIIDAWYDSQVRTITADVFLGAGNHTITVHYYEAGGVAVARMGYVALNAPPPPPPPAGNWFNEYFTNTSLSGAPTLTGTTTDINFNWGFGAPTAGFPADFFSVRWVRNLHLDAGRYTFSVIADDGVRLWVNNVLVIDQWRVQPATRYTVDVDVAGGAIPIKMEYFENTERAEARLSYARVSGQPGTGGQFPGTATVTAHRLNVRNGPGVNFAAFARLSNGNVVNLTGFRNSDATWVQVSLPNGTIGWVSALYVRTSIPVGNLTPITGTTPPPPAGAVGTVNTGALNVRTGPDVAHPTITTISNGTTVTLLARNAASTWVKVILRDGRQGWVNAGFLILNVPIGSLPVTNL